MKSQSEGTEVLETQKTKEYYMYSVPAKRRATVKGIIEGNTLKIGMAVCTKPTQFCFESGKEYAQKRIDAGRKERAIIRHRAPVKDNHGNVIKTQSPFYQEIPLENGNIPGKVFHDAALEMIQAQDMVVRVAKQSDNGTSENPGTPG